MVRCWLIGFCSDTYSDICGRVICQTAIRELHLVFTPVRGRGAVGDTGRHAGGNCADIKLDLVKSANSKHSDRGNNDHRYVLEPSELSDISLICN